MAIAPARAKTQNGCVTISSAPSATSVSVAEAEQEEHHDADAGDDRDRRRASTRSSRCQAIQIVPTTRPKNSPAIAIGLVFEQAFEHRRQRRDRREDADEQCDQPDPLDVAKRLPEPGDVAGQQLFEATCTGPDVADQPVVDPQDERNGSTGHTRHDVGGAHGEPACDLRDVVEG